MSTIACERHLSPGCFFRPKRCVARRLDKLLYVPFPVPAERAEILRALTHKMPLASAVDLRAIAEDRRTEGFSGADLAGLSREAAMMALQEVRCQRHVVAWRLLGFFRL